MYCVPVCAVVVVVCHGPVRRQISQGFRCRGSLMHELISSDSAMDPLVTSQSGICCKRTSVSHLMVKLHRLYICRLVLRTPYDCSPAIDGSVLIVAGRECIFVFRSVSVPRPILGGGGGSLPQYSVVAQEFIIRIYRVCVQIPEAFLPACAESWKNS